MPIRDAWEVLRARERRRHVGGPEARIQANRKAPTSVDDEIGCFVLSQPFFFSSPVAQPEDWSGSIQGGKYYHLTESVAQRVWRDVSIALAADQPQVAASPFGGYGTPVWQPTRLAAGSVPEARPDAYGRRCRVSGEHTVPVLQASHIKPFAASNNMR